MSQTRQPKGTPVGGQWGGRQQAESQQPLAAVHGTVSAYATKLSAAAVEEATRAKAESAGSDSAAAALRAQADEIRARSAEKGVLGRFVGKRKATKATRQADAAAHRGLALRLAAQEASREADRMNAGIDAERKVVQALSTTPGVRQVVCGINLGPGVGDIDATAVGSRTIVVEVKAGGGELRIGAGGAVSHGERSTPGAPLAQCARQVDTLREAGVDSVGVVCFPGAPAQKIFDKSSGCWLVGGSESLQQVVSKALTEGQPTQSADGATIVSRVRQRLDARYAEVAGWVDDVGAKNQVAHTRIAKWENDIARSAGWSNGAEIRANLTRMVHENNEHIARRTEKCKAWVGLAMQIRQAIKENDDLAKSLWSRNLDPDCTD